MIISTNVLNWICFVVIIIIGTPPNNVKS